MRVLSQGDGLIQHRAQPESNLTPDNGTAGWDLQVRFPSIAELGGVPMCCLAGWAGDVVVVGSSAVGL